MWQAINLNQMTSLASSMNYFEITSGSPSYFEASMKIEGH